MLFNKVGILSLLFTILIKNVLQKCPLDTGFSSQNERRIPTKSTHSLFLYMLLIVLSN